MDVSLTAAMRSNLLTLQNTTSNIGKIQNILATGKSVNSALDDPTAFFASQALLNRSDDLSALLDGMGQSIQTLQAADDGITAMTDMLEQMQSVAQSAKDGASQDVGGWMLSGDISVASTTTDLVAGGLLAATDQIVLNNGGAGGDLTVAVGAAGSLKSIADAVNADSRFKATIVDGTKEGTYRLKIESTDATSLVYSGTNLPNILAGTNVAGGATGVTSAGTAIADAGATLAAVNGAPEDQTTLESSFTELISQFGQLVSDAGYRGTNLLDGQDLSTTFNEDGSSEYTVKGKTYEIGAADSRVTISSTFSFGSLSSINAVLDSIDESLTNLRADAKAFGSSLAVVQTREDFTKNVIANLKEGSDKLVLADTNEEGAKLLSLQTSQQLGIQALSLAAQSQQSVLQLFS